MHMSAEIHTGDETGLGLLAGLLEAVPVGALLVDVHGCIRFANHELAMLLGYEAGELHGRPVEELLPAALRDAHVALRDDYLQQLQRRPMGQGRTLYARRRDGSELPVEIGLNPVTSGGAPYVLATLTDLGPRLRADQLFRRVVECAPYGIVVIDAHGRILLANPLAGELFGYAPDDLAGRPVEDLLPQRYRSAHVGQRAQFGAAPSMRRMGPGRDLTGLHRDGSEFPVEIGLNPIDWHGEPCMLAAITDITERKRMELDLRKTNANLEEFTYVASHDLRSPLRGISDLLSWIREDLGEHPAAALVKNLDRITIRVQRMEQLIDNLLSYARAGRARRHRCARGRPRTIARSRLRTRAAAAGFRDRARSGGAHAGQPADAARNRAAQPDRQRHQAPRPRPRHDPHRQRRRQPLLPPDGHGRRPGHSEAGAGAHLQAVPDAHLRRARRYRHRPGGVAATGRSPRRPAGRDVRSRTPQHHLPRLVAAIPAPGPAR